MSFRAKELHDIRPVHISEAFPSLESGHLYKKTIKNAIRLSSWPVWRQAGHSVIILSLPWACCRRGSPVAASVRWWRRWALWRRQRPVPSSSWSSWPRCRWSGRTERRARTENASALQQEDEKQTEIKANCQTIRTSRPTATTQPLAAETTVTWRQPVSES